jgi:hypothetical protein
VVKPASGHYSFLQRRVKQARFAEWSSSCFRGRMAGRGLLTEAVGLVAVKGCIGRMELSARRAGAQDAGVVIPVYLPEGRDRSRATALLDETTSAYCAQAGDPALVCLSVDGARFGAEAAGEITRIYGASIVVAETNRGKLAAARNGVRQLLAEQAPPYIAIVDQDGDHFANELANLLRVALDIEERLAGRGVMVLGQRATRHRPLGFLRGELEGLADRVLLDALAYRAAVIGRPLGLEYALAHGDCPDFHSGYKLFDRETAEAVFLGEPNQAGTPDSCYYRHACEAVMTVEALENGAYLGVAHRSTMNGQPVSVFGQYDTRELTADMIAWPCKRLGVPLAFVEQWLANHAQQLLLHTLSPQGEQELEAVRRLVVQAYDSGGGPEPFLRPVFV